MTKARKSSLPRRRAGVVRSFLTNDEGISAVTVAISLLVLMGMAAIALDGGNLYQKRRSAQNAADQAVVAASYTDCVGGTVDEARQAGVDAARDNGYDNADPEITVTVTNTGPGQYRAEVITDVDSTFGQTVGADDLGTSAVAIASCELGIGQVTALFAHASGCDDELTITLDDSTITGGVHSNGTIAIPGDRPTIEGGVTYGVVHPDDGSGTDINPGNGIYDSGTPPHDYDPAPTQTVTDADFPIAWDISDYATGGHFDTILPSSLYDDSHSGTFKDETVEGIYYVDGDIILQENITVGPRGVTFVATGLIRSSENNQTFFNFDHPDNQDLLMFSTRGSGGCDDTTAIDITGDNVDLTGIIFAPDGKADVQGDGNNSVAIWGNFVQATGDGFDIDAPSLKGFGDPEISFDE